MQAEVQHSTLVFPILFNMNPGKIKMYVLPNKQKIMPRAKQNRYYVQLIGRQPGGRSRWCAGCAPGHPEIVKVSRINLIAGVEGKTSYLKTQWPKTADGVDTAGTRRPGEEER